MRVGRISSIKMMTNRDVRALLKMFSMKGVSTASKRELSDIQSITTKNENNAKDRLKARNALNSMIIETTKDTMLRVAENKSGLLAEKQKLNIIKSMEKAKEGVKLSSLDMIAKTQVNSELIKNINKTDDNSTKNTVEVDKNYGEQNISQTKEQKSILEEYSQLLKTLEEKREKELENKKNTEENEDEKNKDFYTDIEKKKDCLI